MDDRSTKEILEQFNKLRGESAQIRRGVVSAASPLSVKLGGSDIALTGVRALDGLRLAVNDQIVALKRGNDVIVIGRIGSGRVRGQVGSDGSITRGSGFTAAKNSTGVYTVTFTVAFPAVPIVVATPAGSTLGVNVATADHAVGSFRAFCSNAAGSAADSAFTFIADPV
jgi:hypothetical protein